MRDSEAVTPRGTLGNSAAEELDRLRADIGRVDAVLVDLLAERVRLARAVGAAKRGAGLGVLDPAREAAVVRRVGVLAREAELEEEEVRDIFWRVIGLCRRTQLEAHPEARGDARAEARAESRAEARLGAVPCGRAPAVSGRRVAGARAGEATA